MTIKGILFDKDGTLFDFDRTWGVITKKLVETESAHNISQIPDLAETLGFDLKRCVFHPGSLVIASTSADVARAILPFTADLDENALLARMSTITAQVHQVQVTDLKLLFTKLKAQNLKLGIATNDAYEPAMANLQQVNVDNLFDFIAGSDSGFGAKPAPGQLLAFCNHVNLQPDQCVMVGDSLHDLHAGRAAKMRTVGVLTGPASRADLLPFADVVMDTIADILAWLDQLRTSTD